jgi:FAD/FMN-containing dehydrogenase
MGDAERAPLTQAACGAHGRPSGDPIPWRNWARNQEIHPKGIYRPKSVDDLVCLVQEVSARGGRIRGVGTGLSFSDILQTDDALVQLTDLLGEGQPGVLLPLEEDLWRNPTPPEPRVRIPAGARIRFLNTALAGAGLGFSNLGGYDCQTIIGALSTSTHGSGIGLAPLPDAVVSLDLVTTGGRRLRIEPTRGITDPDKFAKRYGTAITLLQDDDTFYSVVVSMGCMGIVTSVVMQVRAAYRLWEHRRVMDYSAVHRELEGRVFDRVRHYEISMNPFPRRDGDYTCIVTTRRVAPQEADNIPLPPAHRRAEALLFLSTTQDGLVRLMRNQPRFIPFILEEGIRNLETTRAGHIEDSYRIFNLGEVNTAEVLSGEYFFPIRDNIYLKALQRLLAVVDRNRRRGLYQNGPISLRFIKASRAYLSMAHGEEYCSMEIPVFTETPGAAEMLLSYEQATYELGGRVHWGQLHELSGTRGWLATAYPKAAAWSGVYKQMNDRRVFSNHFTDRMGLP